MAVLEPARGDHGLGIDRLDHVSQLIARVLHRQRRDDDADFRRSEIHCDRLDNVRALHDHDVGTPQPRLREDSSVAFGQVGQLSPIKPFGAIAEKGLAIRRIHGRRGAGTRLRHPRKKVVERLPPPPSLPGIGGDLLGRREFHRCRLLPCSHKSTRGLFWSLASRAAVLAGCQTQPISDPGTQVE